MGKLSTFIKKRLFRPKYVSHMVVTLKYQLASSIAYVHIILGHLHSSTYTVIFRLNHSNLDVSVGLELFWISNHVSTWKYVTRFVSFYSRYIGIIYHAPIVVKISSHMFNFFFVLVQLWVSSIFMFDVYFDIFILSKHFFKFLFNRNFKTFENLF